MNFKKTHPNFEGGVAAQGVYNRLNAFKEARCDIIFRNFLWS